MFLDDCRPSDELFSVFCQSTRFLFKMPWYFIKFMMVSCTQASGGETGPQLQRSSTTLDSMSYLPCINPSFHTWSACCKRFTFYININKTLAVFLKQYGHDRF
ncbi:hypothetical protein XENORESO_010239 [Xenotaenia resolanae]|uniref:Uncharacterized protein n=1 Tax=Xenotaenia resolanae TaxID=208358 RepID=A0ABV0W1P5_9TELE